jgi:tetratricopeptide (TPR) repeat protein
MSYNSSPSPETPGHITVPQRLALALQHLSEGRLADAEILCHAILEEMPGHVDARCYLASIRHRQGKLREAVAVFSEAVRLAPGHLMANMGIAEALRDLRQPAAAEPHYRIAVQLNPHYAPAHYGLGRVLRDRQKTPEAIECFRETIRIQPQHADAHTCLALLLMSEGRINEARDGFQTALRLDPNNSWAFSGLSRLAAAGEFSFSNDELGRLETMACRSNGPIKERISLYFALARVREQAGDYDKAFTHYRQANELLKDYLRSVAMAYDSVRHTRLVNGLIAVCTPEFFEGVRSFGVASEVPIFVVGMPRSGTTLAEQILASHPSVCGAGELHDISQIVIKLGQRLGGPDKYPGSLGRLEPGPVRALAEEYLAKLQQCGGAATRVVDKMPLNYQHLGVIAALFPRARVIHCRREPIDTCLSCYFQDFAWPLPFGPDLSHLGSHYREYERLMAHYTRVLPLPLFELRYEELIDNQEAVTRRLLDFCGLEWDDRCLRFHETERTVNTSNTLQVRKPLYRSSVDRWKRYEAHLAPLLQALGHRTTTH